VFVDVFDAFIFGDGAVDGFVPVRRRAVQDGGDDFPVGEFQEPRDDVIIV